MEVAPGVRTRGVKGGCSGERGAGKEVVPGSGGLVMEGGGGGSVGRSSTNAINQQFDVVFFLFSSYKYL